jgi:hypothetical protein
MRIVFSFSVGDFEWLVCHTFPALDDGAGGRESASGERPELRGDDGAAGTGTALRPARLATDHETVALDAGRPVKSLRHWDHCSFR